MSSVFKVFLRGRLHDGQQIAVKRFSKDAWPDEEQFREKAIAVGRLRHRRLVNLIGYCCHENERLLVAEFMPNNSLARHLFNVKTKIMERSRCLKVACYIAEALEYCIKEHALYYDLNPHKVLFDEASNPCLSCFGLVKNLEDARCFHTNIAYTPPGCVYGMTSAKSMIYSFGILLRDLLRGKQISNEQAMDAILGTSIPIVMDSRLWAKCSAEVATALLELAYHCLQYKPIDRPSIKDVIATLAQIQSNAAGLGQHKTTPMHVGNSEAS
ncbi:Non-specific serine/threonine protein kinase protein [Dioscorea alata]|uniref:Non-specific serine/threonine protein kinase protein n=1 Tax=Dioscorea alata TaxID=55571 RepID=A0ACB7V6Z1_DIOAL|nr:Non-specific serine/threonine protein kinase protein [Dioscorea alata]